MWRLLWIFSACCFLRIDAGRWRGLRHAKAGASGNPEIIKSMGVRGGVPEKTGREVEPADEEYLGESLWKSSGMQGQFRFMDDLYPVAPMDRVAPDAGVESTQAVPLTGSAMVRKPDYIAPYKIPDPFPHVSGRRCMCEQPPLLQPTPEQIRWHRLVSRHIRIPVDELPMPLYAEGRVKCECVGEMDQKQWVNIDPVPNSNNFTITPADSTFSGGDHWAPRVHRSGVVAPMDRLPKKDYPLQARVDRSYLLPAVAREDTLSKSFARYVDQVAEKSSECDTVSDRCTVPCKPGDVVTLSLLNTVHEAKIISTHMGNTVLVEYSPVAGKSEVSAPCPLEASCSLFRVCRRVPGASMSPLAKPVPGSQCMEQISTHEFDFDGSLERTLRCPRGTMACKTVQQVMSARNLAKDGKACRSAPSDRSTQPQW